MGNGEGGGGKKQGAGGEGEKAKGVGNMGKVRKRIKGEGGMSYWGRVGWELRYWVSSWVRS